MANEEPKRRSVDIIASGYEWTCPDCEEYHKVIELKETVTCRFCGLVFETNEVHAFGYA